MGAGIGEMCFLTKKTLAFPTKYATLINKSSIYRSPAMMSNEFSLKKQAPDWKAIVI